MTPRKTLSWSAAALALLLSTALLPAGAAHAAGTAAKPAAPRLAGYPTATVPFEGHGWGHGRGMGQYGALGYATNFGWDFNQILDHFYGGTQMANAGASTIRVRLTQMVGVPTIVAQEKGEAMVVGQSGTYGALMAVLVGPNRYQVYSGANCAGPTWTPVGGQVTGPVTIASSVGTPTSSSDHTNLLQTCEPTGSHWYRGNLLAVDAGGAGSAADQRTVNVLALDDYVLGVVTSESPASWGDLPGGMNALDAQAVAARSYGAASHRYSYADICDTTSCQVYRGRAFQQGGAYQDVETANGMKAVLATSQLIRTFTATGLPASTEFSSSTGGYTVAGTFPAVPDDGDAVASNPYHLWSAAIPVADIEAAYPAIGSLQAITVTNRDGLGDWGGRVLGVRLTGTGGSVDTTGADIAANFGLRTNWFRVLDAPPPPPDHGGYWTADAHGTVNHFGSAPDFGSILPQTTLTYPIAALAATADRAGYYLVDANGGFWPFGDAQGLPPTRGGHLNQPVVGTAIHHNGASTGGYWLVASDGGIFSYGDAGFFGSAGAIHLNKPIVGMAPTPTGNGYWLVASDGGIFSYGDAAFFGSTGSIHLNQPIVGMTPTPDGQGYWLVASDGGIFSYGDAAFFGSTGSIHLNQPIVGMAATNTGGGYFLVARDGGIFTYGDAYFVGSAPAAPGAPPVVGIAVK